MPLQKLSLVLGGASSGKSAFAERLVVASGRPKVYLATAEAWDLEMQEKIARHRDMRGPSWRTVEEPRATAGALGEISPTEAVLLDCATLWLTNQMLADADLGAAEAELAEALASCPAPVVVVSNEVGLGLVPDTPLGRRFRNAQGALNQRLAAQADLVVFVAAGLPLVLKGTLP
ncbi:bifunctional adenosylcobinamide kinase/adenosylcobinamide-phosphate guanylyltransferase [Rubellimicrobium arenae]|uniref:bifunctional adenosylcobinamide kinase/adenosylcobinamide-phosphate guanylyltransferase n=1 Tax=Rubellimicrobium arenae TaxID=2817372 RepID=UPI001FEDE7DB|nr:bifunctional adenosylcobinamide kinase/adenosylcobinamide-phosphate guanylyltransferase [Rubellimicrobium arenae]